MYRRTYVLKSFQINTKHTIFLQNSNEVHNTSAFNLPVTKIKKLIICFYQSKFQKMAIIFQGSV